MKKFWKKLSRFQKLYLSSLILFLIILPVVGITTGMFSATPTIFRAGTSTEIAAPFDQAAVTQVGTAIRSVGDLSQNSFTFEAWINPNQFTDPTKKQIIFGKATTRRYQTIVAGPPLLDYSLSLTSESISATYYDLNNLQTLQAKTNFTPGKWQHIALVKDASTAKLFFDGKLIASTTSIPGPALSPLATDSGNLTDRGSILYIAGHPEYNSFQGKIDEVRISSIALYTQDFSPSLSPFETEENALALYHFDGNTQDVINPSAKSNLIGQIDYTTSTIFVPEPSPPVFNCFDSCKQDSNCSKRLRCIDVKGSLRCANPQCPTKANCACPEPPPPPEPTPPPGSECSTDAECHLSLCDCKCHPSGQTPEEQTGKVCGINCLDEFKASGCKCSEGTCSEIYVRPSPTSTPRPTPGPCEPNYLISFSVSQPCDKSNFSQVDFKCRHSVPPMPDTKADTCQSISQWFEYAQSRCQKVVFECFQPTPKPTPKPTPRPTPSPKPTPSPQYSQEDIESSCRLIDRYTNLETYTGTDEEKQKLQRLINLASRIGLLSKVKITNVDQLLEFYYTYCKPKPTPTTSPMPISNQPPVISATSLPSGQVNKNYQATIRGYDEDQDQITMNFSELPPDLAFHSCISTHEAGRHYLDCLLTGIPQASGTFNIKISLTDEHAASDQTTLSLTIKPQSIITRFIESTGQRNRCIRRCRKQGGKSWPCFRDCTKNPNAY